jgi:hypothetical protein
MNFNILSQTEGFALFSLEVIPSTIRSASIRIRVEVFDGFWTDDVTVDLVATNGALHEIRKSVVEVTGLKIGQERECDAVGEFEFFIGEPVTFEGYLTSLVCNFSISFQGIEASNKTTAATPHGTRAFNAYFVIGIILLLVELFGVFQMQKDSLAKLSILTASSLTASHMYTLLWHISLSSAYNPILIYIICLVNIGVLYTSTTRLYRLFE